MPQPLSTCHRWVARRSLGLLAAPLVLGAIACSGATDAPPPATSSAPSTPMGTTDGTAVDRVVTTLVAGLGLDATASGCVRQALAGVPGPAPGASDNLVQLERRLVDAVDGCHARDQLIRRIASGVGDASAAACLERVLRDASADELAAVIGGDAGPIQSCEPSTSAPGSP